MEFGRRLAIEKDIERNEANQFSNMVFDESGLFLIYGSCLGVKSNLENNTQQQQKLFIQ